MTPISNSTSTTATPTATTPTASSDSLVTSTAVADSKPWAFWAPTPDGIVERALDLAGVGPGMRFLDLGCGDGRVLVAAARRGADVRGIEINPNGRVARTNLTAASVPGSSMSRHVTAAIDAM